MESVTRKTENGIESPYFNVTYRPSVDNSNFNLNLCCSSLLTYMALADMTRDQVEIGKLQNKFIEALSHCNTEEEKKNFATFLKMVAEVGGYASTFYESHISHVLTQESEQKHGDHDDIKIQTVNDKPVSQRIKGGFASEYFNVKYRPKGGLDDIDISCSSILTYMALADLTRDEKEITKLMVKFCETLLMCNSQEDFNNLATFMREVSKIGGYAIEFNNRVSNLINENGKIKAQEYLKTIEKETPTNSNHLEEFKKSFMQLNRQLQEFKDNNVKDDQEIAYLLKKYNELQSTLYGFNGTVDKEFIANCDLQIEEAITYLRKVYNILEDVKNTTLDF